MLAMICLLCPAPLQQEPLVFRQTHWIVANQIALPYGTFREKFKRKHKYSSINIDFCSIVWYNKISMICRCGFA
nr:MAG TPA: hypothetical protein [Caudoviricetes sp.]